MSMIDRNIKIVKTNAVCGLPIKIDLKEYAALKFLGGELEICLHTCPDIEVKGDVNRCPIIQKWISRESEANDKLEKDLERMEI